MNTREFAAQIKHSINHTIDAHAQNPKSPDDAVRFWDRRTPYAIHPIWSAMTLLTETKLPVEIRHIGYQVLLWHDTLEDTTLPLPANIDSYVRDLIQEMTFASFSDEVECLWSRSDTTKLFKLYDKVSNLLDAVWMEPARWNRQVEHATKLLDFVRAKYGELNIVKIARVVCIPK